MVPGANQRRHPFLAIFLRRDGLTMEHINLRRLARYFLTFHSFRIYIQAFTDTSVSLSMHLVPRRTAAILEDCPQELSFACVLAGAAVLCAL